MTGIEGLRCPECGRTARNEHKLFKRRRGRWRVAFAALLLMLSGGLAKAPGVIFDGPVTILPTWAWLTVLPYIDNDEEIIYELEKRWRRGEIRFGQADRLALVLSRKLGATSSLLANRRRHHNLYREVLERSSRRATIVVEHLLEQLGDAKEAVDQAEIINAIAMTHHHTSVSLDACIDVLPTLFKSVPQMRGPLANAVSSFGAVAEPALPVLIELVNEGEDDPQTKFAMLFSLSFFGDTSQEAHDLLMSHALGEHPKSDPKMRDMAVRFVFGQTAHGRFSQADYDRVADAALASDDPQIVSLPYLWMARNDSTDAAALAQGLDAQDDWARFEVATRILELEGAQGAFGAQAIDALKDMARNAQDAHYRGEAMRKLIGLVSMAEFVDSMLFDATAEDPTGHMDFLMRIGLGDQTGTIRAAVLKASQHPNPAVRLAFLRWIDQQPKARPSQWRMSAAYVVDHVRTLMSDDDAEVAELANTIFVNHPPYNEKWVTPPAKEEDE